MYELEYSIINAHTIGVNHIIYCHTRGRIIQTLIGQPTAWNTRGSYIENVNIITTRWLMLGYASDKLSKLPVVEVIVTCMSYTLSPHMLDAQTYQEFAILYIRCAISLNIELQVQVTTMLDM